MASNRYLFMCFFFWRFDWLARPHQAAVDNRILIPPMTAPTKVSRSFQETIEYILSTRKIVSADGPLEWPFLPPLEWPLPSAQRRNPLPAQAQRRGGARFPDRAPLLLWRR